MFKSLKRRGEKVKERVDFKFTFQATKVPLSGWDKLVVSVVPLETGRVSFKTTRVPVKNGTCNWPDAVIESTKLSQDSKTKEYDEKLYKIVVSSGSSRSGVLGEVTIDVADYTTSNNPSQISLPLRNCNAGTILHMNITCLTPRSTSGRNLSRTRTADRNEIALEDDEVLSASDEDDLDDSDQSGNLTTGSVASNNSAPAPNFTTPTKVPQGTNGSHSRSQNDGLQRRPSSEGLNPATPRGGGGQNGSQRSSTSDLSPSSSINSGTERNDQGGSGKLENNRERERDRGSHRSASSQDSNYIASSLPRAYARGSGTPTHNGPSTPNSNGQDAQGRSNGRGEWASQRSRLTAENGSSRVSSSMTDLGGKDALQADLAAAETTIEELRLETVAAQRHNRKLKIEIETLKQQVESHIRDGAENGIEMSTLAAERDRLKLELDQIKSSKLALQERENGEGNARWRMEDAQGIIQELQEETRYQKEQNNNLSMQLRKTQDSNMELVLAIRDLEESLEQQKKESEELIIVNNELEDHLVSKQRDSFAELEQEWHLRVSRLEEDKKVLEAKVLSLEKAQYSAKPDDEHVLKMEKMIEQLTRDVEDLEKESKELADENMELYTSVEDLKKEIQLKTTLISQLEEEVKKALQPTVASRALPEESSAITDLRNNVKDLESKLSASELAYNSQLKRSKGHVEQIQFLVEELRTANVHLEGRLKDSVAAAEGAAAELEAIKLESARFENERDELEVQRKDLESRVAVERETLERNLAEAREAFAAQEQELRTIEESATRAEEERSIALDKIVGLEDDISRLKAETRSIVESKSTGDNSVSHLQMQMDELEELKKNAEAECLRMGEHLREREAEVSQLLLQIASHLAERKLLEASMADLEREKSELQSTIQDSLEEDRLSKSRVEELEFQLSLLSEELDSVNFTKREFEEHSSRLEVEKRGLELERKELEIKLQSVEKDDKTLKDQVELFAAELTTLRAQMDTQTSSRRNLERQKSELESSKDELYNQLTDLEEENLKHTERISELEAQLRSVTEERETHKLEREILETRSVDHVTEKGKLETALQMAAKEHQQRVSSLEAKLAELVKESEGYRSSQEELQVHVQKLEQDAVGHVESVKAMKERIQSLESINLALETKLQEMTENHSVASKSVASLEAEMVALRTEHEDKTGKFLLDLENLRQSHVESDQRAKHAEESLRSARWEKAAAVERLQMEVQRLTEQMTSTNDDKEILASEALVQASELRAEKGEWEERLRQAEDKLKLANEESSSLKTDYGARLQDLLSQNEALKSREHETTFKLSETVREFGDLKAKEVALRNHAEDVERKLTLVLNEKEQLEEEVEELKIRVQDSEMLGFEIQRMQSTVRQLRSERDGFDDATKNLKVVNELLEEEKNRLEEDITAWEKENEELKHAKVAVEEKILRLQLELESQGTARSLEAEQRSESIKLRRQNSEFKRKLTEYEEEKEEFRRKVQSLEGELKQRSDTLGVVEKKLKDKDHDEYGRPVSNGGSPGFLQRSLSRSNSKINPMGSPSRDTKEMNELREKVKILEADVESKATALDTLKKDFSAKESILYKKIELLEGANEQLAHGDPDLGMDHQLQMELTRLQNLNALLSRRERELLSQLSTQEVLHKEVQRLQEENEQLEIRFTRFKDTTKFGNIAERMLSLETELAEAMEANAMYKTQLQNAFAKQQNVQAAALQNYGDVDQIIGELVKLKIKASKSEEDAKDLRERYTTMSLKYAEVSSQKEELSMALRNLRNGKKS
ncbi:unnamed protein product [Calypogeia fissa]